MGDKDAVNVTTLCGQIDHTSAKDFIFFGWTTRCSSRLLALASGDFLNYDTAAGRGQQLIMLLYWPKCIFY